MVSSKFAHRRETRGTPTICHTIKPPVLAPPPPPPPGPGPDTILIAVTEWEIYDGPGWPGYWNIASHNITISHVGAGFYSHSWDEGAFTYSQKLELHAGNGGAMFDLWGTVTKPDAAVAHAKRMNLSWNDNGYTERGYYCDDKDPWVLGHVGLIIIDDTG